MGWIAIALPRRCVRVRRARPLPEYGDPLHHTTIMLIMSQHVSIVERLVDRHSPT
jgi:hypothetical protein